MKTLGQISYMEASAVDNMALDVAMLRMGGEEGMALWRFYGWNEEAITFGYSQKWNEIEKSLPGFEGSCVRRMTGGGLVDHRNDLTYALTIPSGHDLYRTHANTVYKGVHHIIMLILREMGFQSGLAECGKTCEGSTISSVSICFRAPEPYDVIDVATGQKQAGAAMKRNRSGLLIQGSLSLDVLRGLDRMVFENEFGKATACWLNLSPQAVPALPEAIVLAEQERFSSRSWNQRR